MNGISAAVCLKCHNPDSCAADGLSDTAMCSNHWRNENTYFISHQNEKKKFCR